MAIPFEIEGQTKKSGLVRAHMYNPRIDDRFGESSLIVYTIPREEPVPLILPFLNDANGNAMNQNAAFGGTPVEVHNGTDTAEWTGSNITGGKVTFNSAFTGTGWPPAGTKSVKVDKAAVGDVWQFAKGSSQDLTSYTAITMKIWIDKDWKANDSISIYGFDGGVVGNEVFLEDYMDEFNFKETMSISIPLSDMGLASASIDSIRMEQISKEGKAPKFYLDTIQIEETGGGLEYRVTHDPATKYCVNKFVVTITDLLAGTLANGAGMIPLSYDQILGLPELSNGILLRSFIDGDVSFSGTFRKISDFTAVGFMITNAMSDGTNTSITLEQSFPDPLIIRGSTDLNFISMTVNDDLSGLLQLSALLRGSEVKNI
tara:strand:- start:1255 stop:2373 length:1119 start_codon:yes stop_codon:yes gene_type:complete